MPDPKDQENYDSESIRAHGERLAEGREQSPEEIPEDEVLKKISDAKLAEDVGRGKRIVQPKEMIARLKELSRRFESGEADENPSEFVQSYDDLMKATLDAMVADPADVIGEALDRTESSTSELVDTFNEVLEEASLGAYDPTEAMAEALEAPGHPRLEGGLKVRTLPHFEGLPLPEYKSKWASGMDLIAAISEPIHLNSIGSTAMIPTGICVEVPVGFEAQIRPRSGLAAKSGITVLNTPGTVDADYRGEVKIILTNVGGRRFTVERGMRIAQMVICPVVQADLHLVEELSETERGDSGYGSTGV